MTILSELQPLNHPLFKKHHVHVQVKRDDIIHPIISGNKWRKLQGNLTHIQNTKNINGVISFGGSFSNHIHALAFACYQQKIPCVGIIRGEPHYANNYTLSWARHWGMQLHFVDRKTYRLRDTPDYLLRLQKEFPNHLIVPEGGTNEYALSGVAKVISELNQQTEYDTLITPTGSGGTLAGLIYGDYNLSKQNHKLLGVAVLKNADYLVKKIQTLLPPSALGHNNWELITEFHRGGYAKFSADDAARILDFNQTTGVDFEPVYSGKMILAVLDLLEQGYFAKGERIVLLHTGGMQGVGGMIERGLLDSKHWPMPKKVT